RVRGDRPGHLRRRNHLPNHPRAAPSGARPRPELATRPKEASMTAFLRRNGGLAALAVSLLAVILALTGIAGAARKPHRHAVVRTDSHGKVPAKLLPKVAKAKNADKLGGH